MDLNALGDLLLTPIIHALNGVTHLIICPDGMLNLLSFEMIRFNEKYLILNYMISYLISSKDLLRKKQYSWGNPSIPITIVNPDYNLTDEILSPDNLHVSSINHKYEKELYEILDGAEGEGREIHKIIGGQLLIGKKVSVQNFLTINSPSILHIITHGNFWGIPDDNHKSWDSLVRSGLVLAGRNAILLGKSIPSAFGAGLVTAWQISEMNLTSTELVVLATCESGLGDILYSEGIFGLHRSFFIAGGRTLIVSLAKVDDEVTSKLMVHFYTLLMQGRGKADALHEAKLNIFRDYQYPYFWASFKLYGDFGPLKSLNK